MHYSTQDTAFPSAVWNANRDDREEFVLENDNPSLQDSAVLEGAPQFC